MRGPVLAAALVALAGCASLPDIQVDRALGAQTAKSVEAQVGLVDDRALSAYVGAVGRRVASALPDRQFDYRFAVLDQAEPNAFAAPGGHVFVSRGLLALTRNEAELAGVLAHEIEHVERRHSVRQLQRKARLGLLALPGVLVTGVVSADLAALVARPFEAVAAKYSRDQEREADARGQPLAAAAGYDPLALPAVLGRMERFIETLTDETRAPGFFDSHPSTPERVGALAQQARTLAVAARPGIAVNAGAYLRRLDGLLFGDNVSEGVVRDNEVLHPDLDFRIAFPKSWTVENTPTAIAAMSPNQDGVAAFGLAGRGEAADLPAIADEFAARLEKDYGTRPELRDGATAAGLPAQAVIVTDHSGPEPVHLYFLWVADRGRIFQMIGIAPHAQVAMVRAIVETLRPLTATERASIAELRLRVVAARPGESLEAVSRRAGGVLPIPVLTVLNGHGFGQALAPGEPVKVVVRVPYRPAR